MTLREIECPTRLITCGIVYFFNIVPWWSPEITNTLFFNTRKALFATVPAAMLIEPINHYYNSMKAINLVYEWPKNLTEWSIYVRETFRTPKFFTNLRHKYN
jgi:hypothetical protein